MPNSKTFKINCIKDLILKYRNVLHNSNGGRLKIIDPFANESSISQYLINDNYISNDLDTDYKTDYNLEAQDFLQLFDSNSIDMILYDPPYSGRQVAECYKKNAQDYNNARY